MKKLSLQLLKIKFISFTLGMSHFLCFYTPAFSQNALWAKSGTVDPNSPASDVGYGVATDVSGNVYVTGSFNSPTITFGSYILTKVGNQNFFLVKYDASGNVLWAKNWGASGFDVSHSVTTDASGNVYVTGLFGLNSIFWTDTLTSVFNDVFLAKFNSSGTLLWYKKSVISNYNSWGTGAANLNKGCGVATDNSGNVYITGWFTSSTIQFGNYTLTNTGYWDNFLVKYDSFGNVLWAKNISGPSFNWDGSYSVATDASGNAYVTGSRAYRYFFSKYDASSGNLLWNNNAGGTAYYSFGTDVSMDASGNIYVTGAFTGTTLTLGNYTLINTNSAGNTQDIFLVKYDVYGTVLWAINAGNNYADVGHSVATDALGNIYMMGSFSKLDNIIFGTDTLISPAGSDNPLFITKFDSNGNVLYASALASGGAGYGYNYNAIATFACNV